jgi:hypothetical protein
MKKNSHLFRDHLVTSVECIEIQWNSNGNRFKGKRRPEFVKGIKRMHKRNRRRRGIRFSPNHAIKIAIFHLSRGIYPSRSSREMFRAYFIVALNFAKLRGLRRCSHLRSPGQMSGFTGERELPRS